MMKTYVSEMLTQPRSINRDYLFTPDNFLAQNVARNIFHTLINNLGFKYYYNLLS